MDDGRREFSLGLASALITMGGSYAGYRLATGSPPPSPPAQAPPAPTPHVIHSAIVNARLGTPLLRRNPVWAYDAQGTPLPPTARPHAHAQLPAALGFDRRTPFAIVREILLALGRARIEQIEAVETFEQVELEVEVRADGPLYPARIPLALDRGSVPAIHAIEARLRAASVDPMHGPQSFTAVVSSPDATIIHRGQHKEHLAPLLDPTKRASRWDDTMWRVANCGAVCRSRGRSPWLFAHDDCPWSTIVTALEALSPIRCQPDRAGSKGRCTESWATLFIGGRIPSEFAPDLS